MFGLQNQHCQPWISSFGLIACVHIEVIFRVGHMHRDDGEVKGSFMEEPIIHIVFFLEQTLQASNQYYQHHI